MTLYPYQQEAVDKILSCYNDGDKGFGLFFEMGLGKTITTIKSINKIYPKNILIVCPLSLVDMWKWELNKNLESRYIFYNNQVTEIKEHSIVITNYESLHKLRVKDWDFVVLDECQKVKNYKTQIWKIVNGLKRKFTLALSGTPMTNTYMDLFSIGRLISDIFDMPASIFERYFIKDNSKSRTEELFENIKPFTAFAKLTDHIDMPKEEDIEIWCNFDEIDQMAYRTIYSDYTLDSLSLITKLISICGIVDSDKLLKCKDLVKTILDKNEKVVIFTTRQLAFNKLCQIFNCPGICGSTTNRQEIVEEFNKNGTILVCNIKAGGLGLNLQSANNVIYWQHDYELGSLEQSKGRIFRIGQDKPCKYYHLMYVNTIETQIYDCLVHKKNVINELLKFYRRDV